MERKFMNVLGWLTMLLLAVCVVWSVNAHATKPSPPPPPPPPAGIDIDASLGQTQGQVTDVVAKSGDSVSTGGVGISTGTGTGTGGTGEATIEGFTTNNITDNDFFAFSTSFPEPYKCFKGYQGGGSDGSGGGLISWHSLDKNCWSQLMAEAEKNAEVRARLKCQGKEFRNAITFELAGRPKKQRHRACVDYMTAIHRHEIEVESERIQLIEENNRLKQAETERRVKEELAK